MGVRIRKSINIGGGFRINFSKSGIGYSYGGKGARVTHTARGNKRITLSLPGTGLSWVSEARKKKRYPMATSTRISSIQENTDQVLTSNVESNSTENLVSANETDFINSIKRYRLVQKMLIWLVIIGFFVTIGGFSNKPYYNYVVLLWCLLFTLTIIHKFACGVKLIYSFDEYGKNKTELVSQVVRKIHSVNTVWQINSIYANQNSKVHAGAAESLSTSKVRISMKKPSFIKTNVSVYEVKLKKEKIYVFPDKLIVVSGHKIGVIHHDDLNIKIANTNFIVDVAPRDARIVGYTWKYVNKNGGPDKRFKDNRQMPICDVGTMEFKSSQGLNVMIYLSNVYTTLEVSSLLTGKSLSASLNVK